MLRLGLTGGIGSGKSTVAEMLRVRGATVIDADAISRGTTAAGGAANRSRTTRLALQQRMSSRSGSKPSCSKISRTVRPLMVGSARGRCAWRLCRLNATLRPSC